MKLRQVQVQLYIVNIGQHTLKVVACSVSILSHNGMLGG